MTSTSPRLHLFKNLKLCPKPYLTFLMVKTSVSKTLMFAGISFLTIPEEQYVSQCEVSAARILHGTTVHLLGDNRRQPQA